MSAHVATARNHRPFEQDIVVNQLLSVLDADIKWLPLGFVMKNHEVKTKIKKKKFLNFAKNAFRIFPSKIIVRRWVSKPNSDNLGVFFITFSIFIQVRAKRSGHLSVLLTQTGLVEHTCPTKQQ